MKALLLATLLALSSTALAQTPAPPAQHIQILPLQKRTLEQYEAMGGVCVALLTNKITFQTVVDTLKLTDQASQQLVVDQCSLYMLGVSDGIHAAQNEQNKGGNDIDASRSKLIN